MPLPTRPTRPPTCRRDHDDDDDDDGGGGTDTVPAPLPKGTLKVLKAAERGGARAAGAGAGAS